MSSNQFYLNLLPEVDQVITELGRSFTVSTPGVYDPTTMTTLPPSTREVEGVVADQTLSVSIGLMLNLGSNNSWEGRKMLILKASANPKEGESINVDGQVFALSAIEEVKPANITLLYMLNISK